MDSEDELCIIYDELEHTRLPNSEYVPSGVSSQQQGQSQEEPPLDSSPHLRYSDVSNEDTEDASEDGDFLTPRILGAGVNSGGVCEGSVGISVSLAGVGGNHKGENERELKEQAYFDKLNLIKIQLQELEERKHTKFTTGLTRLQMELDNRLEINKESHKSELSCIERDFSNEEQLYKKEFADKKIELQERVIRQLEEKRKQIEMERWCPRHSIGWISDPAEVKQLSTRKLRRRPNDPVPLPERRKKAPHSELTFLLSDQEIEEDCKAVQNIMLASRGGISGGGGDKPSSGKGKKSVSHVEMDYSLESPHSDSRIEDGKLFYEKRWFHRGQPVFVEGQGMPKTGGVVCSISQDLVLIRKVNEQTKIRVPISALQKGKLYIKRRAS